MSEDNISLYGCDEITEEKFQDLKNDLGSEVVSMTDEEGCVVQVEKVVFKKDDIVCLAFKMKGQCLLVRSNMDVSDYFFSHLVLDAFEGKVLENVAKIYVLGLIDIASEFPVKTGKVSVIGFMAETTDTNQQAIFLKKQDRLLTLDRRAIAAEPCDPILYDASPVYHGAKATSLTPGQYAEIKKKIALYDQTVPRQSTHYDQPAWS